MKKVLFIALMMLPLITSAQLRQRRAVEVLGGAAVNNGAGGYNLALSLGPQWEHFAVGSYMSFISTPSNKFWNFTIAGLQMKVLAGNDQIRPYGVFGFGLFNFQGINDKINMRTASFDLGAGIDKPMKNGNGFLVDGRWKWLVDYAGKRETIGVLTLSVGLRF
ncbi:MAG TPA: hypothetical protein VFE50_09400 [Cyclobacteriaceae bacterium]|nr:hypothetical protein [Cyclobacteriaceae bacterium]